MVTFHCGDVLLANHAASVTCATGWLSLAHCGGFHRPQRFRCGATAARARSKRPDLRSDLKVRTPWPPSRPQRCPERFIRAVTRTLFANSTAPDRWRSLRRRRPRSSCGGGCCGSRSPKFQYPVCAQCRKCLCPPLPRRVGKCVRPACRCPRRHRAAWMQQVCPILHNRTISGIWFAYTRHRPR